MNSFRSDCPVSSILDLVGDKWTLLIIRDLFLDRNTFSDFLKEGPEKISSNILVDRLKKLSDLGIIEFKRDKHDKKIKYYKLTASGLDFYPLLVEMALWSNKHIKMDFHPNLYTLLEEIDSKGKETHIKEVIENYVENKL